MVGYYFETAKAFLALLLYRPLSLDFLLEGNTVEPLLKDTPNKGHNTFDLSIKDKFCGPYRTMAIQFYL